MLGAAVSSLRDIGASIDVTQRRLASGRRVGEAADDPPAYFAARSLAGRATDLTALKEAMGQAIQTIKAGDTGIQAIGTLLEQARGLTVTAYANLNTDPTSLLTRRGLAQQFDRIIGLSVTHAWL